MKQSYLILLLIFFSSAYGQRYSRISEAKTSPESIIINNYSPLSLPAAQKKKSSFDITNSDTYMMILRDRNEGICHILYQTDFEGNLNFIALSNNLIGFFNCNDRTLIDFYNCIKKTADAFFPGELSAKVISCILSRLNSCGD